MLKSQLRPSTINGLIAHRESADLVIAPSVTSNVGHKLRIMGLNYLDAAGNAHLQRDGLFIHVEGGTSSESPRKQAKPANSPSRLLTTAALPLVLTVLSRPELLDGPTRALADLVPSSLGTVHSTLKAIRATGCTWDGENRVLHGGGELLDLWTDEYVLRGRERRGSRRR